MTKPTWIAIVAVMVLVGCGGQPEEGVIPPEPVKELTQPLLQMVAPSALSAGDLVTVFGTGFADPEIGETRVIFEGVFQSTAGQTEQVQLEVTPRIVNQGMLEWTFGPNIPFSRNDETGTFRGLVKAYNIGLDGTIKQAPQALSAQVQVRPSIIIKQMRPLNAGCAVGITDTVEDSKFLVEVKVVGLKSGTSVAPLRFAYTFMKENFQFEGYLSDQLALDPEGLFPAQGPVTVIDDVHDGFVSHLGSGVPKDLHVHRGAPASVAGLTTGLDSLFKLTHLKTAPIPTLAADYFDAMINVMAVDSTGATAKRTIPLRIWTPIEVSYDGAAEVVRSFDPVPVSGCMHGGKIGRDVTYSEISAETRTRSFKVLGKVSAGFDIKVARLNAEFGVEVNSEVSSSQAKNLLITGAILPNEYAAFYRQTLQVERVAKLKAHGPCGNTSDLGTVVVTDWVWSPDLAKGWSCPPLPQSNLAKGQVFNPVK